jgi:hypothetical protein
MQSRENSAVRKAFSSGGTASGTLVDAKWRAVRVVWRHRVVVGSDGTAVSAIALTVAPLSVPPLSSLPVLSTAAMAGCSYQQRGLGGRFRRRRRARRLRRRIHPLRCGAR